MNIVIQVELIFSLIIMSLLVFFSWWAGKKVKAANPLEKPKGVVLILEVLVDMFQKFERSVMPANLEKTYFPYFFLMFAYIFISNISGLLGFDSPTSNLSITLTLGIISWVNIHIVAIKANGWGYFKRFIDPIPILLPMNIISTFTPIVSLSLRLFGNILSGAVLMSLVYSFTAWISMTLLNSPINFLGALVAPWLHMYFDIFAGAVQTFIFITLSSINIALEA